MKHLKTANTLLHTNFFYNYEYLIWETVETNIRLYMLFHRNESPLKVLLRVMRVNVIELSVRTYYIITFTRAHLREISTNSAEIDRDNLLHHDKVTIHFEPNQNSRR